MIRIAVALFACSAALGCSAGDVTESGVEQSYKEQGAKADALNKAQGIERPAKDPNEPQ